MTTSFSLSLPGSQAAAQTARRLGGLGLALLLPAAILYLWQLAATHEWVTPLLLPAPAMVLQALVDLHASGELWEHLGISLGRVGWGYLAGVVLGLALGAAMGLSKTVEAYLMPSFKAVSLVPVLGAAATAAMRTTGGSRRSVRRTRARGFCGRGQRAAAPRAAARISIAWLRPSQRRGS